MSVLLYIFGCLAVTLHQNVCLFLCKKGADKVAEKKNKTAYKHKYVQSWQIYDDFSAYSVADRNQSVARLLYVDVLFHNNASFNGNYVVGFYEEVFENDLC